MVSCTAVKSAFFFRFGSLKHPVCVCVSQWVNHLKQAVWMQVWKSSTPQAWWLHGKVLLLYFNPDNHHIYTTKLKALCHFCFVQISYFDVTVLCYLLPSHWCLPKFILNLLILVTRCLKSGIIIEALNDRNVYQWKSFILFCQATIQKKD